MTTKNWKNFSTIEITLGYGGIPYGDRNDQIQLSTCTPVGSADEIDPNTLHPPQWGYQWTLEEAHEILIGPKNDPFCFVVFPGADSVTIWLLLFKISFWISLSF